MKTTIKLQDFFDYAKIDYKEDLWDSIYHDYYKNDIDTILYNLKGTRYEKLITKELLERHEEVYFAIDRALNRASETGLEQEAMKKQMKSAEAYADKLEDILNNIVYNWDGEALNKKGNIKLTVNWQKDILEIEGNIENLLYCIVEIINGEGYFRYNNGKELAGAYGDTGREAIKSHLHYLLNGKLISEIWGERLDFDWEVNSWDIDEEAFEEYIYDELLELKSNRDFLIKEAKKEAREKIKALKELEPILEKI